MTLIIFHTPGKCGGERGELSWCMVVCLVRRWTTPQRQYALVHPSCSLACSMLKNGTPWQGRAASSFHEADWWGRDDIISLDNKSLSWPPAAAAAVLPPLPPLSSRSIPQAHPSDPAFFLPSVLYLIYRKLP